MSSKWCQFCCLEKPSCLLESDLGTISRVSKTSLNGILHNDVLLFPYKIQTVQTLNSSDHADEMLVMFLSFDNIFFSSDAHYPTTKEFFGNSFTELSKLQLRNLVAASRSNKLLQRLYGGVNWYPKEMISTGHPAARIYLQWTFSYEDISKAQFTSATQNQLKN